jgi:AraC family transcriptional regulator
MSSEALMRYQEVYPSAAILRSFDVVRPRASELLNLEYFEADPDTMPTEVFEQHHLLLNLKPEPHRLENWRDGEHRDFTYVRDEIILTPAGIRSGWRWHARSRVIVITIEPARLAHFVHSELGLLLGDRQLEDVPQRHDPELVQSGVQLLNALQSRSTGSEVIYESLARVFVTQLIDRYGLTRAVAAPLGRGLGPSQYKRVVDYVAANYAKPLPIEELSGVAGISPAHFSRLFKELVGDTPHQFVMDYRVERAKALLADPAHPLADIAVTCGFADQSHFNRVFKRLTGKTPREWRAQ